MSGFSKRDVEGAKGTPFSRCVVAAAQEESPGGLADSDLFPGRP